MASTEKNLTGLGQAALAAVAAAEATARELGATRLGTEHLLLGVLSVEKCDAARALRVASVGLPAARRKVVEATAGRPEVAARAGSAAGRREGASPPDLPRSPRAERAFGRAFRFAHEARSVLVRSEHLLLGVLDVEGTAGQVLRGLGADVERIRASLEAVDASVPEAEAARGDIRPAGSTSGRVKPPPPPTCPSCSGPLAGALVYRIMPSSPADTTSGHPDRDAVVLSCGRCGTVLGVASS